MTLERTGGELPIIAWAQLPGAAEDIYEILAVTDDDALMLLMREIGGRSGRLAWAEWGRRKFGVQFAVQDGDATPVHYTPSRFWS